MQWQAEFEKMIRSCVNRAHDVSAFRLEIQSRYSSYEEKRRKLSGLKEAARKTVLPGCTIDEYSDDEYDRWSLAHRAASNCIFQVSKWSAKRLDLTTELDGLLLEERHQNMMLLKYTMQPWPSHELQGVHKLELKALATPYAGEHHELCHVLKHKLHALAKQPQEDKKEWNRKYRDCESLRWKVDRVRSRYERRVLQLKGLQIDEVQAKGTLARQLAQRRVGRYMVERAAKAGRLGWPTLAYQEAALLREQVLTEQLLQLPSAVTAAAGAGDAVAAARERAAARGGGATARPPLPAVAAALAARLAVALAAAEATRGEGAAVEAEDFPAVAGPIAAVARAAGGPRGVAEASGARSAPSGASLGCFAFMSLQKNKPCH